MLDRITTYSILPAAEALNTQVDLFVQKVELFSNNPDSLHLLEVQQAWRTTTASWAQVELYNFGPIKDRYLYLNVFRAPTDTSSVIGAIQDTFSINADFIQARSSKSTGLSAIEYLIFTPTNNPQQILHQYQNDTFAPRRKQYLLETAYKLQKTCQAIKDIWIPQQENYAATFSGAEGNDLQSGISMLANALISLVQNIARTKLGKPLGKEDSLGFLYPDRVESPYANHSLVLIKNNLQSIQSTFTANNQQGIDDYLNHLKNGEELATQIKEKLEGALAKVDALQGTLAFVLIQQTTEVDALYQEIRELLILLNTDMAALLDITVLPNDNDGD